MKRLVIRVALMFGIAWTIWSAYSVFPLFLELGKNGYNRHLGYR